jgi:hypothetical protein
METIVCFVLVAVIVILLAGCVIMYKRLRKTNEMNRRLEDRILHLELELFDSTLEISSFKGQPTDN